VRLVSSRDPADVVPFTHAVLHNLPAGGGLYVPAALPRFEDWDALLAADFPSRSTELLHRLLGEELERRTLGALVEAAFPFGAPLRQVAPGRFALELFHGPTLAFKDFGARFLAQVLGLLCREGRASAPRLVLVATSGDTGAAVAHAFWRLPGFRVVVLYPRGRVSPLQEQQLASLGDNVQALSVEGSFDDCQALVKGCFADAALSRELGLTSANSINIARLLAQVLYYVDALAQLRAQGEPRAPVFSVPSGNFGNLCAGVMARQLGLPVRAFVVATNANRTVPDYLDSGRYRPRPSVATHSNAMDVGDPSNWERIEHLLGGDLEALRRLLRWGHLSDVDTQASLRALQRQGYLADPHAAVAAGVLERHLAPGELGVFLATAHPAKFREVLAELLGVQVPLPPALAQLTQRPVLSTPLSVDPAALRRLLRGGAEAPSPSGRGPG
jgi:threonine synthase